MTTSDTENDLRPVIPRLSKSKFLSGLQCHKRLYLEMRHPELAETYRTWFKLIWDLLPPR